MTQVTGNDPYAAPWEGGAPEQKTSVMAVTALVLSLICFIPGLSVLAIILGIAALLVISRSRGRVRGTGLAVGAIILGLIVSTLYIGGVVGAAQVAGLFKTQFVEPTANSFKALEAGDLATARGIFSPATSSALPDDQLIVFRDAYLAEVGKFKNSLDALPDFMDYGQIAQLMQPYQGRNDMIPLAARFEKGVALVVVVLDTAGMQSGTAGGKALVVKNLIVVSQKGTTIDLSAPAGLPDPAASTPTPPSTPDEAPGDGTAKKNEPGDGSEKK